MKAMLSEIKENVQGTTNNFLQIMEIHEVRLPLNLTQGPVT